MSENWVFGLIKTPLFNYILHQAILGHLHAYQITLLSRAGVLIRHFVEPAQQCLELEQATTTTTTHYSADASEIEFTMLRHEYLSIISFCKSAMSCWISLATQSMSFSGLLPLVGQGNLKQITSYIIWSLAWKQ